MADTHAQAIWVFSPNASGDVAPLRSIAGSNTKLSFPQGMGIDSRGRAFTTDNPSNAITVYATGAAGNAAPAQMISGSATHMNFPVGIGLH